MPEALSRLIQSLAAVELQRLVDDDISDIDSDSLADTAAKGGYDAGWCHRVLYTQKQSVWNVTHNRNQELRQATRAELEPKGIAMFLPSGVAPEPKPSKRRSFSKLTKRQTRANDDDVIMPAPAYIAPTWHVTPIQVRSTAIRAEKDGILMLSRSAWGTEQENGVDDIWTSDVAQDDLMRFPADLDLGNQRDAEDTQYTVLEETTSASRWRQPAPSSDNDEDESNVPDRFDKDAWDDYDDVDLFDLSRVRPDNDKELL